MVNVDCLQSPRPKIDKPMRNAGGSQNRFASFCFNHLISDEEPGATRYDNEGLIIGMNVKVWTSPRLIIAIGENSCP